MQMSYKPKAIFYCGTNGAGKSTLRQFNQDNVNIVIDSDHIAKELNPTNPRAADIEAGKRALQLYRQAIAQRISFSMESTLSGKSILQRMRNAKENGFEVILNYVGLTHPDLNVQRVQKRVNAGGHWIDETLIRQRFSESRKNLPMAIEYADSVYLYDNSADFPDLQLTLLSGQCYCFPFLADWVQGVKNELRISTVDNTTLL